MSVGEYVNLGPCMAQIEAEGEERISFYRVTEELAEGKLDKFYETFERYQRTRIWFETPMWNGRRIRVLAIRFLPDRGLLRLKIEVEPLKSGGDNFIEIKYH